MVDGIITEQLLNLTHLRDNLIEEYNSQYCYEAPERRPTVDTYGFEKTAHILMRYSNIESIIIDDLHDIFCHPKTNDPSPRPINLVLNRLIAYLEGVVPQ